MNDSTNNAEAYQRALTPSTIFTPRTITTVLQTAIISYWVGVPIAASWCAAILVLEVAANPYLVRRFVDPHQRTDPSRARRNGAVIIMFGTCVHMLGWCPAWLIGGPSASILGMMWLTSGIINALTYFTNSRLQFIACIAPATIGCVIIPILQHSVAPWLMAGAAIIIVMAAIQAYEARDLLSALLIKSRAERRAAMQSSQAKTQFLATMSHELRTPLNAIIGYAEILEEDQAAAGAVESARDASRIRRAATHLLGLITEILDFSKIEAGKMEMSYGDADIGALLAEVAETAQPLAAENNNKIALAVAPEIGHVFTDGGKVRQCLLNLVSNACKFTTDGSITIDARINSAGLLQIAVKDTGCGVPAEQAALLFQPFVQVDGSITRKRDGTGLGLVITRRLAQLLGGDVVMDSTPRIGSTFTLTIAAPAAAGGDRATQAEKAA